MEKKLQELHEDVFTLYGRLQQTLRWAKEKVKVNSDEMEYCADVAFAMYELDKLLKDVGVEVRKTRELAEMMACKCWLLGSDAEPIRTEHCTASPDVKMQPKMPKKGSAELAELLDWLGVKDNHDAVRIHWPTLCDIMTQQVEKTGRYPSCIDPKNMHNPSAVLRFYKKKDVTD